MHTDIEPPKHDAQGHPPAVHIDALIIGAKFLRCFMLHKPRTAGIIAKVIEAATSCGGVWYWSSYPRAQLSTF